MAFADLVFFATLFGVVLFSTVVLLLQFLRGDLAQRRSTTRLHRTYAPSMSRRRKRVALGQSRRVIIGSAVSHRHHLSVR
jgi:hypothetical protein